MMLGGMLIPFLYGFTLGEKMTLLKGVAMAFVLASMLFTLKKEDDKLSFLKVLKTGENNGLDKRTG